MLPVLLQLLFSLSVCYHDNWFSRRGNIFLVGAVSALLRTMPFIVVDDSILKLSPEIGSFFRNFAPEEENGSHHLNCRRDAGLTGRLSNIHLLLHGKQVDHPKTNQRPFQFRACPLGSSAAKRATTKGLLKGSELQFSVPIIIPPKITLLLSSH